MEERMRQDRLLRRTAFLSVLFSLAAVCAMGIYIWSGSGGYVGAPGAAALQTEEEAQIEMDNVRAMETDYLCIPLPEGFGGDRVKITDQYVDHTVMIDMEEVATDFYADKVLSGNSGPVRDVRYGYQDGRVRIELLLDGLYEHQAVYEKDNLYLKFVSPRELYKKIVVIDAGHGGTACGTNAYGQMEKDITLDVVLKLKELLDRTDIKAYYTRLDDSNPDFEARVGLANQSRADFFLSVHVNGDQNTRTSSGTEVLFNESFFIPGFGSRQLAEILQRNVTEVLKSRDRGILGGDETAYIIKNAKVPAALVEIGFLTNKKEAQLMGKNSYRQKAAEGIYAAVMEAYGELDKTEARNAAERDTDEADGGKAGKVKEVSGKAGNAKEAGGGEGGGPE